MKIKLLLSFFLLGMFCSLANGKEGKTSVILKNTGNSKPETVGFTGQNTADAIPPCSLTISMSSTPFFCTSSSEGSATVTPLGGTSPYTYSWLPGGQTSSTISGLNTGTYSVTVTDFGGCTATGSVAVDTATITANATLPLIAAGDSTLLSATYYAPLTTYYWFPSAYVTNPNAQTTYAYPPVTTIFTVYAITSCSGAYTTDTVTVTGCSFTCNLGGTNYYCDSLAGSLVARPSGGTPPYTYSWAPGGQTASNITGLSPGRYYVLVTDSNGCKNLIADTVTTNTILYSVSGSPRTIVRGSYTNLVSGCSIAATYSWAPAATVTNPNSARTTAYPVNNTIYTVTITTPCGSYIDSVPIYVQCFPINISATYACTSSYDGTATVSVSGGTSPYTYSWVPGGQTTSTITGLSAGAYYVEVYDNTGCSSKDEVWVNSASEDYSLTATPMYINAGDSSLLSIWSNPPSTFSWTPLATVTYPDSANTYVHPSVSTEYTVTITSACGTFIDSVLVNIQCFPLSADSTFSYPCGSSSSDGTASVIPLGGTPPYTYSWSPDGGTTSTITGLPPNYYSVIVQDATGCSASTIVGVWPASTLLTVSASPPVISSGDSSYLSASTHLPLSYSWAPPTGLSCTTCADPWASPIVTTVYTVTVDDSCAGVLTGYDTVVVSACTNIFDESICIVTVDTATNKCEVIWGRTNSPPAGGFGSFYVYKDSAGNYGLTHTQPLNVLSQYIDLVSNPSAGPESY